MERFRELLQHWHARTFKVPPGYEVSFLLIHRKWYAKVRERIGRCFRTQWLPVGCVEYVGVQAALKDLQGKPAEYVEQHIHVMETGGTDGGKWVRLGKKQVTTSRNDSVCSNGSEEALVGPEEESTMDPAATLQVKQEECMPLALEDISNIKDLVRSLDECRRPEDKEKMNVLQACVRECKNTFASKDIGCWTENSGCALHEYSILASIKIHANKQLDHFVDEKRELLQEVFTSLAEKITIASYSHASLIDAIGFLLCKMDVSVFAEKPGWVHEISLKLLERLDHTNKRYTRAHYAEHQSTFLALYRALIIIRLVDPDQWDSKKEKNLLTQFMEGLRSIKESSRYYPVRFHILVLEQCIVRLTSGEKGCAILERATAFLLGMLDIHHFLCHLTTGYTFPFGIFGRGLNTVKLLSGWNHIVEGLSVTEIRRSHWFDALMELNDAYIMSLTETNEENPGLIQHLRNFEAEERNTHTDEELIALRFGFVQQLCKIVLNHPTPDVRKSSLNNLLDCATRWQANGEILEEILESLVRIADHYGCDDEEKQATRKALEILQDAQNNDGFWSMDKSMKEQDRGAEHAKQAVDMWKGGQDLEKKVKYQPIRSDPSSKIWFGTIKDCLGEKGAQQAAVCAHELKHHYRNACFAWMPSFLPDVKAKHVRSLECQLMLVRRNHGDRVSHSEGDCVQTYLTRNKASKNPIDLGDIFRKGFLNPGERGHEIRKVIVVGQAGAGKTTLSHKLAYEWSEGRWCKDLFDNVYVLPVRDLSKSEYDNSCIRKEKNLATAIANVCFLGHRSDDEYNALRCHINTNLKSSKTLVVLDGFDEQHGVQMQILEEAKSKTDKEHRLLVLSRPHGVVDEAADREVEHTGFSTQQVEAYVKNELSPEHYCEDLLNFIRQNPSLKEIVHMPLNLALLCKIWKDPHDRDIVCSHAGSGSAPGLYKIFTGYYWAQIERKKADQELENIDQETFFTKLGKIALHGLTQKEEMFTRGFIRDALGENGQGGVDNMLIMAGYLLIGCNEDCFRFPHKTFQEYFAGRLVARLLLSDEPVNVRKGEDALQEHKYRHQSRKMLLFMAGEMSRERGQESVWRILTMIDREPREAAGLQHVLLQLQVLCECISSARCTIEWDAPLEEKFKLVESVLAWLHKGLHMKHDDYLRSNMLNLLTNALARSHAFLSHMPELQNMLIGILEEKGSTSQGLTIHALGTIFGTPHCEPPNCVLDILLRESRNNAERTCLEAIHSLGLVFKTYHFQSKKITDCLIWCLHDDRSTVRREAVWTLISVFKYLSAREIETVLEKVLIAIERGGGSFMTVEIFQQILAASPSQDALLKYFSHIVKNREHTIRAATMTVLGGIFFKISASKRSVVLQILISSFRNDTHDSVRLAATKSLGVVFIATQDHQVSEVLMRATNDEDVSVQLYALQSLLAIGTNDLLGKDILDGLWAHLIDICFENHDNHWSEALCILGTLFEPSLIQAEIILEKLMAVAKDTSDQLTHSGANDALINIFKRHLSMYPDIVQHFITRSQNRFGTIVRLDSIQRLGMLAIGSQENVHCVWESLVDLSSDEDANIQYYALETLVTVVRGNPSEFPGFSKCLCKALKDKKGFVHSKARSLLAKIPAQYLIEQYWVTKDDELIPAIASGLCKAALVFEKHDRHFYDIVLYQTTEDTINRWSKPSHEAESFHERLTTFLV